MRPTRLTLRNYRPFNSCSIDLNTVEAVAIIGPNGAGKSAIVEALSWALYGDSRSAGVDGVVRLGAAEAAVELDFEHNGESYKIIRKRSLGKKSDLQLLLRNCDGFKPISGTTIADTQARIDRMLAMDSKLFCATSCVSQGDSAGICAATPAERKAVLYRVLEDRLNRFPVLAEKAKRRVKELDTLIAELRARRKALEEQAADIDTIGQEAAAVRDRIQTAEQSIAELDAEIELHRQRLSRLQLEAAARANVQQALADVIKQIATERSALARHEVERKQAREYLQGTERTRALAESADALEAEVERWRWLLAELTETENRYRTAQQEAKAKSDRLAAESSRLDREITHTTERREQAAEQARIAESAPCGSNLLTCPIAANVREGAARLTELEARLTALHNKLAENQMALAEAVQECAQIEAESESAIAAVGYDQTAHENAKAAYAEARQARESLQRIAAAQAKLEAAEKAIAETQGRIAALERKQAGLQVQLAGMPPTDEAPVREHLAELQQQREAATAQFAEANRELAVCEERARVAHEAQAQIEPIDTEIAAANHHRELHASLQEAFGRDGIPALIIDNTLPLIEQKANEVLSHLSDGRMRLKLISQKLLQTGGIAETLDIIVSDAAGERPYEDWSGGERLRVDLAVRIALGQLLAQRTGASVDLLILDEVCAPLDQQGEDALVECIDRLRQNFGCILLITHRETLRDRLPQQIVVSADPAGSSAVLV